MYSTAYLATYEPYIHLGETGRISVTGAISVSAVFFFLKIIILIDQKKFLVCLTANFVCQQKNMI